jgi:hypothetical protein
LEPGSFSLAFRTTYREVEGGAELFEAMAQYRPRCLEALLYPN